MYIVIVMSTTFISVLAKGGRVIGVLLHA